MISVVIPVGPMPHHAVYLEEALASVAGQIQPPAAVILVDDMHGLNTFELEKKFPSLSITVWRAPWHTGIPAAFNFGVGIAQTPLVAMMGADDRLAPDALSKAVATWEGHRRAAGYYWWSLIYSDTGEVQDLPCNAAVVTKSLWEITGGFPPESAVGACDSIFISMLLGKRPDLLISVAKGEPLYWYRRHALTDTAGRAVDWQGPIFDVRNILTRDWIPPKWRAL